MPSTDRSPPTCGAEIFTQSGVPMRVSARGRGVPCGCGARCRRARAESLPRTAYAARTGRDASVRSMAAPGTILGWKGDISNPEYAGRPSRKHRNLRCKWPAQFAAMVQPGCMAYGIDGPTGPFTSTNRAAADKAPRPTSTRSQKACSYRRSRTIGHENGIMDLWVREARLLKYGSGTARISRQCAARTKTLRRRAS